MGQSLAQSVLPLIRTRWDLYRYSAANAHGRQMHAAVDLLVAACGTEDPAVVFDVTQRALDAAVRVIARADDSSGIIGDACRRLLDLHPQAAAAAGVAPVRLVEWMITFQFAGEVDYFTIDPIAYAPALGDIGMAQYRQRLAAIAGELGPTPSRADERLVWEQRMADPDAWQRIIGDQATRFTLDWNARRLAILDRDIDAIITTHLRDGSVAAWHQDVAHALAEADQGELAIEWAKKGADFDHGHQAVSAAHYWCQLLAEHHPDQELAARQEVFHRWPTAAHAADLRRTAGDQWPLYRDAVMGAFPQQDGGRQAVSFALYSLGDVDEAWRIAQRSDLGDSRLWSDLAAAYEAIDPVAVLPVHTRLVELELAEADAAAYRRAAVRLARMRILAAGSGQASDVEAFIAELRDTHRRRPRLQREFDRAGLH